MTVILLLNCIKYRKISDTALLAHHLQVKTEAHQNLYNSSGCCSNESQLDLYRLINKSYTQLGFHMMIKRVSIDFRRAGPRPFVYNAIVKLGLSNLPIFNVQF